LQLHLLHHNAGAVIVERLLHQFLHRGLDGLPRAGEDGLNVGVPDHHAHRAFADRLHRAFRPLHVEALKGLVCRSHRKTGISDSWQSFDLSAKSSGQAPLARKNSRPL
jgi:hypothetical protein